MGAGDEITDAIDAVLGALARVDWAAVAADGYDLAFAYWGVLQIALIVTAVLIFISSVEDAFLDALYWLTVTFRNERHPPTEELRAHRERMAAIMVPAWQESEVIARMLVNAVNNTDYKNFHIFVGVYPNDPRTAIEVDNVSNHFANVHRADVSHGGPTNKADCLNHLIAGVLEYEAKHGVRFEMFVNHDAEDVVHPLGLKVMNYFLDDHGMVQLPVRSLDRSQDHFVACTYMDEFAEWHGKDLVARSVLSGMTPSAGVGTAFSRDAIDALMRDRGGDAFNTTSLTEDYDIASRLNQLGFRSRFVRYWAKMPNVRGRQLVDTREYFPHRITTSYRQKARWMLGISFFGWRQLGWHGGLMTRYFLWRDRKALFTAPAAMVGYVIVLSWLLYSGLVAQFPVFEDLPPLIDQPWVWSLVYVNLAFLANRLLHRALFTGLAHGPRYVLLSPVRAVIGNFILFLAFVRAMRLYLWHLATGKQVAWDKTRHKFPSADELRNGHQRLGDIVTYWGMVTPSELNQSLANQKHSRRPIGLQLLDDGAIDDSSLAQAFGELLRVDSASFDPLRVPARTRQLLPRLIAARLGAFVIERRKRSRAVVALSEPLNKRQARLLGKFLSRKGVRAVTYRFAPVSDIAFGIRYAYDRKAPLADEIATVALLRKLMLISEAEEKSLWRLIRKDYLRLGDMLVREGAVNHDALMRTVSAYPNGKRLGDRLRLQRLVTGASVEQSLELQPQPPIDVLGIALKAGFLHAEDVERAQRARRRARV